MKNIFENIFVGFFLFAVVSNAGAMSPEEAVAKAKAELFGPKPAPTAKDPPIKLSWGEAYEKSVATGKPLIAWVGVEAQCPD